MILERKVKPTLTPFELSSGDKIRFILQTGEVWEMELLKTEAEITGREYRHKYAYPARGDISSYAFSAQVRVNGREFLLRREVGTPASFYEPWEIDGARLWFDAAACVFKTRGGFMEEKDWLARLICCPCRDARFAIQDAALGICPEELHPWYDCPSNRIDIRDCYNGEDCWLGPYQGAAAHCGLDVNMPAGSYLYAPISFDDHYLFNSLASGQNNNRWRGIRRWPDGSEWHLQSHHLIKMLVTQRAPLAAGTRYATTAGVHIGAHEHTHFIFAVIEQEGEYLLDPWIIFREIFALQKRRC